MFKCPVVKYHYVRPLHGSEFPLLKALDLTKFERQLSYISKNYTTIPLPYFVSYLKEEVKLPKKPCVLVFDDGLKDHMQWVLPVLKKYKMSGTFFIPSNMVSNDVVLAVHKVQFLLAKVGTDVLFDKFQTFMREKYPDEFALLVKAKRYGTYWFDDEKTGKLKYMISAIDDDIQQDVLGSIFLEIFPDEKKFAHTLYLSRDEIFQLHDEGMTIGSHGASHRPLGICDSESQEREVATSQKVLSEIIKAPVNLLSYPKGSFNDRTIEILKRYNYIGAVFNEKGENRYTTSPFKIQNLDTNDLPQ